MNRYTDWFSRALWLGIIINLVLSVPGVFVPNATLRFFGLVQAPEDPFWIAFACLALIILSLFYMPGAVNPIHYRANAWLAVMARLGGVVFFLWGYPELYLAFGILDGVLFLIQAPLLILVVYTEREIGRAELETT